MTTQPVESILFFHLSETHSGLDAARHQRFIEREGLCITSLGTLADTVVERHRVWTAIERAGTRRKGWVELGCVDDALRLEETEKLLRHWVAEGRMQECAVAQWRDGAGRHLAGTVEQNLALDWKCKVITRDGDDHDKILEALQIACNARKGTGAEPLQITHYRPRASVVQRRITVELAPELGIDCQEDVVRTWCESKFAEVSWYACIHRNEDGHGGWRDSVYIVYTQFALERELDGEGWATGGWTFERAGRLPAPAAMINVLWGKGPQGRAGTQALIQRWRNSLVELQNESLDAERVGRRYRAGAHRRHGSPGTVAPVRSMSAQGGGIESSSDATESSSMLELGAEGDVETWLDRWRDALTDEPKGHFVGRTAAAIVETWSAEEKCRRARDPRPEVRALYAYARRWNDGMEKWRRDAERLSDTWTTDEEGRRIARVENLTRALSIEGMGIEEIATREQQNSLEHAQRCGGAIMEAQAAADACRRALDFRRIDRIVTNWISRYTQLIPVCADCERAANTLTDVSRARKIELLEAGLGSTATQGGERLTGIRPTFLDALSGSDDDIDRLLAVERLERDKKYIRGEDRALDAFVSAMDERVNKRWEAMLEAGRTIGIRETVSEAQIIREIAQLTPTNAARWVGRDLKVVRFLVQVWDAVEAPLLRFVPVARRRMVKAKKGARPGEEDRAVATTFSAEELAALDSIAPKVVQTITQANRRAEAQDTQVVEELRSAVWRVSGARDPHERSTLKTELVEKLATERARTALRRVAWMDLARASGLGSMEVADALRIKATENRTFSGNVQLNSHDCQTGPPMDVGG